MENLRQIIKEVISEYKFNKVYILTENFSANILLSEHLKYHIDNNIAPLQSIFRAGSQSHIGLLNEVRVLWENHLLDIDEETKELFESSDLGKYGLFEGKKVPLDFPMEEEIIPEAEYQGKNVPIGKPKRGGAGSKKYYVYVKDPKTKRVKKVSFGDSGSLRSKINNSKARVAFAKRHKCAQKTDKLKPSYWSCRLPYFSKLLGIKTTYRGFW